MAMIEPVNEGQRRRCLKAILNDDIGRLRVLRKVAGLQLPECWVGAGFVRNAVWDRLHGYSQATPTIDIDVVYYDRGMLDPRLDRRFESQLRRCAGLSKVSVKNQARMHLRNGHEEYSSTRDAISRWPETCTAVGASWARGKLDLLAPYGLKDLFDLVVRPTSLHPETAALARRRAEEKNWFRTWPLLRMESAQR